MSRTDKDRPYWVRVLDYNLIDHDHRDGKCIISDDRRERWSMHRHHYRTCKKRVEVVEYCTKKDPHRDWNGQTCWKYVCDEDIPDAWKREHHGCQKMRRVGCIGHKKIERDNSIPCICDDFVRPTCFRSMPYPEGRYTYGGVPSWFVREVYHRPERARERKLRDVMREFNAGEDIEDYDFENRQARNEARWIWW